MLTSTQGKNRIKRLGIKEYRFYPGPRQWLNMALFPSKIWGELISNISDSLLRNNGHQASIIFLHPRAASARVLRPVSSSLFFPWTSMIHSCIQTCTEVRQVLHGALKVAICLITGRLNHAQADFSKGKDSAGCRSGRNVNERLGEVRIRTSKETI